MHRQAKHFYEFGPFRLDIAERVLRRDGEIVQLSPTIFDLLLVLVEHSGHVLDKDDLMRRLWPDTFVEEGNLARNVSRLRAALGESQHDHPYIETVQRRGYRFLAKVREVCDEGHVIASEPAENGIHEAVDGSDGSGKRVADPAPAVQSPAAGTDGHLIASIPRSSMVSAAAAALFGAVLAGLSWYSLAGRKQPSTTPQITRLSISSASRPPLFRRTANTSLMPKPTTSNGAAFGSGTCQR